MRTQFFFPLFIALMAFSPQIPAQPLENLKGKDLKTSLQLLNLYGQQPGEAVEAVYSRAFELLSEDQNASYAAIAQDETLRKLAAEAGMTHLGGPMLGHIRADGVKVWVRTLKPADVEVVVEIGDQQKRFGPVATTVDTGLTAEVEVTGLEPSTSYNYKVLADGQALKIPAGSQIMTAPAPDTTGRVRIGFGSCYHRWGLANQQLTDQILERRPRALLLLGDIAVQDRHNNLGMHRADYLLRDFQQAWQTLSSSIPVYATWDDHDYFKNDGAGIPEGYQLADKEGVWEVFKNSWVNPSYGFDDDRRGVFTSTRVGPCDIIMVDNRYFRKNQQGSFLEEDQMEWLKQQLLEAEGPFIILSCGSMWSDYVSKGKDSWGRNDPEGREEIFRFIEENQIGGVLLISGDRHGARGFTIPRGEEFSFYEFGAASLGGRYGPPATSDDWQDFQLYGVVKKYAFGEFDINAEKEDPEVIFRLIEQDGNIIYEKTLKRSELTP